jgi:hypothetical protein
MTDIWPSTLTSAQANASDLSIYGSIPPKGALDHDVATWVDAVRIQLLAGAPGGGDFSTLQACVDKALRGARYSHLGKEAGAWSAVFVVSCVRQVAIALGLESDSSGSHDGRDGLLVADVGHRYYVLEAYNRSIVPDPMSRTYHAFRPSERPVAVGDIIVVDRQVPNTGKIDDVVKFDDIPSVFTGSYALHGDIVVEVTSDYAETIGGNLGYQEPVGGDLCNLSNVKTTFSSRRRRYPLHTGLSASVDGTLQVVADRLFVQEDQNGDLPPLPVDCPPNDLYDRSTGRVFALLSPVGF